MKLYSTKSHFLLALVLTLSCRKDNPPPDEQFPLSVKATAILSQGSVRLFTHEGEVTDVAVIAQFIAGADGFNEGFEIDPTDFVTFRTDSTAEFKSLIGGTVNVRSEPGDKVMFSYQWMPYLGGTNALTEQFLLDHQRIAATNITKAVPTSTGFQYVGEVIVVASGTYRNFALPTTAYLLSRWRGQGEFATSYYSNSSVLSPFSEDFLKTLGHRDTVAYQEKVIRFSK